MEIEPDWLVEQRPRMVEECSIINWHLYIGGHLSQVAPMKVVQSDSTGILAAVSTGSEVLRAHVPNDHHLRDILPQDRPVAGYRMIPSQWKMGNAFVLFPFSGSYSVWSTYDCDANFSGWYVNLEKHSFCDGAVVVIDHELDVIVDQNYQVVFKDKESFEEKIGVPGYWEEEQANEILTVAENIATRALTGASPFEQPTLQFPEMLTATRKLGEAVLPANLKQVSVNSKY